MEQQQASYSGWALVELMGHQREAGYVTTQYFGDKAMFQIDVPEIAEREETIARPQWGGDVFLPAGSVVQKAAIAGRTRLVNPGAVYALNPATEDAVRAAVAASERREIKVISIAEDKRLTASAEEAVVMVPGELDDDDVDFDD